MTHLPHEPSDADVLAQSLTEPKVFALIYDRHADVVHRFVLRRLGRELAEDITADTFTAAFDTRARFRSQADSARPWLFGIAANLVSKHRRTEVRALRAVARMHADSVAASWTDDADARVEAATSSPQLAAALAALAVGDRNVLLLVAWADLSYAEVSEGLGIPIGTVRSRLHRARHRVRAHLAHSLIGAAPADRFPTTMKVIRND